MKLIFVRHGEPLKDDYGIAEIGKKEMRMLAEYIKDNFNINDIYSASSQRAMESVKELNQLLHKDIKYYDWLSEFKHKLSFGPHSGKFPWEFPPEYWINDDKMLHYKEVLKTNLFDDSEIVNRAKIVWNELDDIIKENGYSRVENLYIANRPNMKELIFVTHFATMAIMIAHLMNISILVALNMLFMAPSSYTVFATEEILEGKVIFRCLELGSTKHLYGKNELKSEYGRQVESRGEEK